MDFMLLLFLMLVFVAEIKATTGKYPTFYESVLLNSSYEKLISPFEYTRKITKITVAIPFVIVVSVEENKQAVSYIAALNVSWIDERLAFDPAALGYESTVIPSALLWIPLVETFNSVELKFLDRETPSNEVRVHFSGEVFMLLKGRFDTVCSCDITDFPFDTQFCNIDFDTGLTPTTEAVLLGKNGSDLVIGLPEWTLDTPIVNVLTQPTSDGKAFSMAKIQFKLTRNPQFYIWFLIVPTMTITLTCITALLLPIDITPAERANLGIAGLLGLTFMLSIIVVEVPRSTNLPLIGKWLIMQMFYSIVAMLWEGPRVFVERFLQRFLHSKRGEDLLHKALAVVVWLLFFLSNIIATLILFSSVKTPMMDPNKMV